MRLVYFWGKEEGVTLDQPWHVFITDPPGAPFPDHDALHHALCGVEWNQLGFGNQPPLSDPHCERCMELLHEDVLAGRAFSENLLRPTTSGAGSGCDRSFGTRRRFDERNRQRGS